MAVDGALGGMKRMVGLNVAKVLPLLKAFRDDPVIFVESLLVEWNSFPGFRQKAPVFCLRFRSTVQIPYKWAALRMPFLATVAHERRFQQQWTAVLPANKAVSMFLAVVLHLV